jgi:hypothetical protein
VAEPIEVGSHPNWRRRNLSLPRSFFMCEFRLVRWTVCLIGVLTSTLSGAMPRPQDKVVRVPHIQLTAKHFEQCATRMQRAAQTLIFFCEVDLPKVQSVDRSQTSHVLRFKQAVEKEVVFGGTRRQVIAQVSENGRSVNISTAFDATGVDFEMMAFNDDFFHIWAKLAQNLIVQALQGERLAVELAKSSEQKKVQRVDLK